MGTGGPGANASGFAAGMLIVGSILCCALVAGLLGLVVGQALPLALAGAAVGVVLGFYAVWTRFFRRSP